MSRGLTLWSTTQSKSLFTTVTGAVVTFLGGTVVVPFFVELEGSGTGLTGFGVVLS